VLLDFIPGTPVTRIVNPITRSVVKVIPAFEPESAEHLEQFTKDTSAYFQAGWSLARLDPQEISAPYGQWCGLRPHIPVDKPWVAPA